MRPGPCRLLSLFSALHLLPQKRCDRLGKLVFKLLAWDAVARRDKHYAAHQIALGNDGSRYGNAVFFVVRHDRHRAAAGLLPVDAAALHDRGELLADGLVHKLTLCAAGNGDDAVSVAHGDNAVGSLA